MHGVCKPSLRSYSWNGLSMQACRISVCFQDTVPKTPLIRRLSVQSAEHAWPGGAQVLYAIAALDVPTFLHSGPKTATELAPLVGAQCNFLSAECWSVAIDRHRAAMSGVSAALHIYR